jgi:hypothetical protein
MGPASEWSYQETFIPEMNCEDSPLYQSLSDRSSKDTSNIDL